MPYERLTKHADTLMHIYYGTPVCDCHGRKMCLLSEQLNTGIATLDVAFFAYCKGHGSVAPFMGGVDSVVDIIGVDYNQFFPKYKNRNLLIERMKSEECCKYQIGTSFCAELDVQKTVYHSPNKMRGYAAVFAAIFHYFNMHRNRLCDDWCTILLCALDQEFMKFYFRLQIEMLLKNCILSTEDKNSKLDELLKTIENLKAFLNDVMINGAGNSLVVLPDKYTCKEGKETTLDDILTLCFVVNNSMKDDKKIQRSGYIQLARDGMRKSKDNAYILTEISSLLSKVSDYICDEQSGKISNDTQREGIKVEYNSLLSTPRQMIIPS